MKHWDDSEVCDLLESIGRKALGEPHETAPMLCPRCGMRAVHVYMNGRQGGLMGGLWIWCSSCLCCTHGSIKPPAWWRNLEGIDPAGLTAHPDPLDSIRDLIDRHWNRLVGGDRLE